MDDKINIIAEEVFPAVALRGFVVFPKTLLHFEVGRRKSIAAILHCMNHDQKIFLIAQKDPEIEDPTGEDLCQFGVVAKIQQVVKGNEDSYKVAVHGLYRAELKEVVSQEDYFESIAIPAPISKIEDELEEQALMRTVQQLFTQYSNLAPQLSKNLSTEANIIQDAEELSDFVGANVFFNFEEKQNLLNISSLSERYALIIETLQKEIHILSLEKDILEKVRENMEFNQRDHFLREQMRAISQELGEDETGMEELEEYRNKIVAKEAGIEITEKLLKEVDKLGKLQYGSPESSVIRNYLDTCLQIPFNEKTKTKIELKKIQKQLDDDHYGMNKVKDRVTELMAVQALTEKSNGQILCLVGPPGIGKTSVGKSIAKAVGRNYVRVSLGGVKDEADIRGHRKTYIGSMPGRVIDALIKAKSSNPLIMFDEIDKMSHDYKGDPASAMLEVLDSEQNKEFRDHYIELPVDLSDVLFICTANDISLIPAPLRDRMDIVEMSSYTRDEKFNIAKKFLVPKQAEKNGVKDNELGIKIHFTDKTLLSMIDDYTRESGVRTLERTISTCYAKAIKECILNKKVKITINEKKLTEYLGAKKFKVEKKNDEKIVGTVNGLAWTSVGGELLPIEVSVLNGTGKIELTGNLGDIMKESARLAVSYLRSVADLYDIDTDFYKNKDIHIHAPEGAVPKDGPSAGIALSTALMSSLSGLPIDQSIAMTGEITLLGKVLAIGGLREKAMAAHRAGVHTVLIPEENVSNLEDIDPIVAKEVRFVPVKTIDEVFSIMFPDMDKHKIGKEKRSTRIDVKKHEFAISQQ